eukprot:CAMPEP_0181103854 /NCGR_PEP_ID=MMETSP1071-20121207/15105_1 /TAXON_ID=35127 /ORGANISM="Thalassiosira sp., Strain NH16" /LENGTH=133 /DNA_ID=CAMNT_0023186991 /DNA_START=393 /DNA_END=790 /DNA_ORIENTATION=-
MSNLCFFARGGGRRLSDAASASAMAFRSAIFRRFHSAASLARASVRSNRSASSNTTTRRFDTSDDAVSRSSSVIMGSTMTWLWRSDSRIIISASRYKARSILGVPAMRRARYHTIDRGMLPHAVLTRLLLPRT